MPGEIAGLYEVVGKALAELATNNYKVVGLMKIRLD